MIRMTTRSSIRVKPFSLSMRLRSICSMGPPWSTRGWFAMTADPIGGPLPEALVGAGRTDECWKEPGARSMAQAAVPDAPAQVRAGAVARVVLLLVDGVEHGEHVVEADRVGPVQGPVRMVEAEEHARVDVLGGAHALAQREGRLVDELAHDPREHQARSVRHPFGVLAQRGEEG